MLRRLVRTTLGLLAASILFLLTIELLLSLWPGLLPPRLANHAFSKYGSFPGGIYFVDLETHMHFMRSQFETEAYFNGYTWSHRTDALGFRNRSGLENRSLLLLGDSLIYGHGIEEEDAVTAQLRRNFQQPAYNMARQGDCLFQNYVLLRLFLDRLRPEEVVLFVFLNDFADVAFYRTAAEMRSPPEIGWDYEEMQSRLVAQEAHTVISPKRLLLGLKSIRLLQGAWRDLEPVSLIASAEAGEETSIAPHFADALLDHDTFRSVSAYYRTLLRDLKQRLDRRGIELHLVNLDVKPRDRGRTRQARRRLDRFLRLTSERLDIHYASTAQAFNACPDCFLPDDGHLSPAGHLRLAEFVDSMLAE